MDVAEVPSIESMSDTLTYQALNVQEVSALPVTAVTELPPDCHLLKGISSADWIRESVKDGKRILF
jgi:hypothetical protein